VIEVTKAPIYFYQWGDAAGLKNLRISVSIKQEDCGTQPSKFLRMETRELKKLADEATGLMAEAAVKASRSLISASISALERHLLGTFSTLAGKLTIVHVTLQNPQPGQEERIFKRLPRFLKQLEAVCSVKASFWICTRIKTSFELMHAF
jgi:hypothetical protein